MIETTEGRRTPTRSQRCPAWAPFSSVRELICLNVSVLSVTHQSWGKASNHSESLPAHNVACGITALSASDITRRLAEGWKMIRTTEAALSQWYASSAAR